MHRRHRHRHGDWGPGACRPRLDREEWIERLEEYQKDLEQEIADVADIIRRLKEDKPAEPVSI